MRGDVSAAASAWLGRRKTACLLSIVALAIFVIVGLVRLYPYRDDVNAGNSTGDDWLHYKLNALSIVDGGLHLPRIEGPYYIPGGFLYNYFVAAVFVVAGPSTGYVYVVQYGCLGLCAVLMVVLARGYMSPLPATALLVTSSLFLYDAFRRWVVHLLSENLLIVLYPAVLLLFSSAMQRRSLWRFAAAGAVTGLVVLTRQNLLLLPFLLAPVVFWSKDSLRRRFGAFSLFITGVTTTVVLLPLRNLYVSQVAVARYGGHLPSDLGNGEMAILIGKRLLVCAGVVIGEWGRVGSDLVINKRWLLLTLLAIASVVYLAVMRRLRVPDVLSVLILAAAYVPFALMPRMGGYGFRFQYPYGPLLLFLIFRGMDEWWLRRSASAPAARSAPALSGRLAALRRTSAAWRRSSGRRER